MTAALACITPQSAIYECMRTKTMRWWYDTQQEIDCLRILKAINECYNNVMSSRENRSTSTCVFFSAFMRDQSGTLRSTLFVETNLLQMAFAKTTKIGL